MEEVSLEEVFNKVLRKIDRQRIISLTRELIRIPSNNPPGNELEVAELLNEKLKELGFKTKIFEAEKNRPNVIGVLEGSKGSPKLILNGHSDTVPAGEWWEVDPYGAEIKEGKIFGRGATDMKGGLASIVCAAEAIQQAGVEMEGDLVVAITVDEEAGGHKGMAYLMKNKLLNGDMAVVCEPSDFKLVLVEEGVLWLAITTLGKSVHTIFAEQGVNAVENMAEFIVKLKKLKENFSHLKNEYIGSPIVSVGTIQGGTKTNIVPDVCKLTLDIRLIPGQETRQITEEIKSIFEELKIENPSFSANANVILGLESIESPKDSKIVHLVKKAIREVLGIKPVFWRNPSLKEDSDMYWLVKYGGIPSVYFGPGKIEQAHATNEHISIEGLVKATRVYAHIILNALGLKN